MPSQTVDGGGGPQCLVCHYESREGLDHRGPTPHSQHLVVFVLLGPRGSPRQGPHSGTSQKLAGMLLAVLGLALGQWDSPTPRKPPSPHDFQITWPFKKKPARTDPDTSFFFSITFMCFQNRNASDLTCIASTLTHSEWEPAALPPISFYTTVYTVVIVVNSVQSQDRIQGELQRQGVEGLFQVYALNIVRGCQDAVRLWVS